MKKVIFGAGDYGKRYFDYMTTKGEHIDCFCQTNVGSTKEVYNGVPLISLDELCGLKEESEVFIALYDKQTSKAIKEKVQKENNKANVIECGEFIFVNLPGKECKEVLYQKNEYEEGVVNSYWKELFLDNNLLCREKKNLTRGMSSRSINEVDRIIERLKNIPYKNVDNDIFCDYEKKMIRKMEWDFQLRKSISNLYGDIIEWNEYKYPAEEGFDPGVWYYQCGVKSLKNIDYIMEKNIIDAGAFIGDSSVVLSQYTNKKVYAFEASKTNYQRIEQICKMNNVTNVVSVNKALSDKTGKEILYLEPSSVGNGVIRREAIDYSGEEEVNATTIDEFSIDKSLEIGLIKADVEGGEIKMLRGASRVIKEQGPSLLISIYHTAEDFMKIRSVVEEINPHYSFEISQPYSRRRVVRDTLLVCEIKK